MLFRWFTQQEEAAFWAKVDRTGTACHLWRGAISSKGYGRFYWLNGTYHAHALAWALQHKASLLPSTPVLHSCDNPACCNPAHLRVGTHRDNAQDRTQRFRHRHGSAHWKAKLTEAAVKEMREQYATGAFTYAALGLQFNVDATTVALVIKRKRWTHVA